MIKIVWALGVTIVCLNTFPSTAPAQFIETFADGDVSHYPAWSGDVSDFTVSTEMLRLQAPPATGQSYLATPSKAIRHASWEIVVRLDFNPSDANNVRIYLASDRENLASPLEGYYVFVGGRNDEVSLYRQDLTGVVRIIDGVDDVTDAADVHLGIRVTCDDDGHWALYVRTLPGEPFALQGEADDQVYAASSYFGLFCKYTSTRADGFYFDDIAVTGIVAPDLGPGPEYKDVIITEIFADPSPAVRLPEVEFIEIHNRTAEARALGGCTVSDGSSVGSLPEVILEPAGYAVLTMPGFRGAFADSVDVVTVAGMPTLNNSGDAIVLRSPKGALIDSVNYALSWHSNAVSAAGGWSLELIDPAYLCGEENNWASSVDPSGGTPGRRNSVFGSKPDQTGPKIARVVALDRSRVRVYFNEKLADEPVLVGDVDFSPPLPVAGVSFADPSLRAIDVVLEDTLALRTLYTVAVNRVRDCSRNMTDDPAEAVPFAVPEEADSLDVVINEILFNPSPGGADFVELFNRSPKFINLKDWRIGDYDVVPGNLRSISERDWLLEPGGYTVLTAEPDAIMNYYPTVRPDLLMKTSLPSLPDDAGSVAVTNAGGRVVDAVSYSSDWHSVFLSSGDGVSLERISAAGASGDPQNWHSASHTGGFATPGSANSNARNETKLPDNAITVDPPVFRPMSSRAGFTLIRYKFDHGGYVANARVLDASGRTIRLLASNDLLGTEGFYTWEGSRDDGARVRVGYYWLWFEVFSSTGQVMTFRERIIVAGDF